jgi:hypothetical protein
MDHVGKGGEKRGSHLLTAAYIRKKLRKEGNSFGISEFLLFYYLDNFYDPKS